MKPNIVNLSKTLMVCGFAALAVGCANQGTLKQQDSISDDLSSSVAFEACLLLLAEPVASANSPATYHLGAKHALACLDDAPLVMNGTLETSVMQVHALAITQFLKSGDVLQAEQQLNSFKAQFPKQDLLLNDGASFVNTIELIVGEVPIAQSAKGSLLNASTALKSELRRHQYWQVN